MARRKIIFLKLQNGLWACSMQLPVNTRPFLHLEQCKYFHVSYQNQNVHRLIITNGFLIPNNLKFYKLTNNFPIQNKTEMPDPIGKPEIS
jgi:hypothetical protein